MDQYQFSAFIRFVLVSHVWLNFCFHFRTSSRYCRVDSVRIALLHCPQCLIDYFFILHTFLARLAETYEFVNDCIVICEHAQTPGEGKKITFRRRRMVVRLNVMIHWNVSHHARLGWTFNNRPKDRSSWAIRGVIIAHSRKMRLSPREFAEFRCRRLAEPEIAVPPRRLQFQCQAQRSGRIISQVVDILDSKLILADCAKQVSLNVSYFPVSTPGSFRRCTTSR